MSQLHRMAVTAALIVAVPFPARAATPAPPPLLTLADAQRIALTNHPDIRVAELDLSAVNEGIAIARAAYHPQAFASGVDAFAGTGARISAPGGINDPTVIRRTALGVGVSQYITDFGRTDDLVAASEADLRAQAAGSDQSRDLVLLNVTESYFDVLRANALVTVAQQTVDERRTLLRRTQALQRAGLRSMLDVSISQRDLASAQQSVLQAQGLRRDAFSNLTTALGYSDVRVYTLRDVTTLPPMPTLTPLLETAIRNNPVLSASRARQTAAGLRAAAISRASYPTLNAYGYFGATPFHAVKTITPGYATAGVTLNVPILTGGSLPAERRQADDEARAALEKARSDENTLLGTIRVAYDAVETARGNISLAQTLLATARDALRFTRARYEIGLSSIADVSQAQLQEEQAAVGGVNATYDYVAQAASLEYATGVLAGADLYPGASSP